MSNQDNHAECADEAFESPQSQIQALSAAAAMSEFQLNWRTIEQSHGQGSGVICPRMQGYIFVSGGKTTCGPHRMGCVADQGDPALAPPGFGVLVQLASLPYKQAVLDDGTRICEFHQLLHLRGCNLCHLQASLQHQPNRQQGFLHLGMPQACHSREVVLADAQHLTVIKQSICGWLG